MISSSRRCCLLFQVLVVLLISLKTSLAASNTGEEDESALECTYFEGRWHTNSTDRTVHYCRLDSERNYELPDSFGTDLTQFESGSTRLKLTSLSPNDETGKLDVVGWAPSFQVVESPQYYYSDERVANIQVKRTAGSRSILVVRVSSADAGSPSFTRDQLSANLFGDNQNPYRNSLQLQFDQCSQGQLQFYPASFGGDDTTGVFDLTIDQNLADRQFDFQAQQWFLQSFSDKFGNLAQYDHVLFCLPRGMAGEFIAFAVLNNNLSFYSDPWCGMMSATMHELGHNLGMRHSGEFREEEYDDESCVMGLGYNRQLGPRKCFNGQKFWAFDWFPQQKTDVFLNGGEWKGNLAAFVDVSSTTMPIVIRVGDMYIAYNEAAKYNAGVNEKENLVTIVQGTTPTSHSLMLAGLDNGDTLQTKATFPDGTTSLVSIEVCDLQQNSAVSFASLSIRPTGTASSCGISQAAPGPAPETAPETGLCSPGGTSCQTDDQCCGSCVLGTLGTVCKGTSGSGGVAMAQQGGTMGGAGGRNMRRLLRKEQGRKRGATIRRQRLFRVERKFERSAVVSCSNTVLHGKYSLQHPNKPPHQVVVLILYSDAGCVVPLLHSFRPERLTGSEPCSNKICFFLFHARSTCDILSSSTCHSIAHFPVDDLVGWPHSSSEVDSVRKPL